MRGMRPFDEAQDRLEARGMSDRKNEKKEKIT
jgi:hypothetical protein